MCQFAYPLGQRVRGEDPVPADGKGAKRKLQRTPERLREWKPLRRITMASGRHTLRKPLDQGLDHRSEDRAREHEPRPQQRVVIGRDRPPGRPRRIGRATASCLNAGHLASIRRLAEAVSVNRRTQPDAIRRSPLAVTLKSSGKVAV